MILFLHVRQTMLSSDLSRLFIICIMYRSEGLRLQSLHGGVFGVLNDVWSFHAF